MTGTHVVVTRGGGELNELVFWAQLETNGIVKQIACSHTPEQNAFISI